jgi:filamentous hemagglutinin
MIVDAVTADSIARGQVSNVIPGGWATFDDVTSIATDMRQRSAILSKFKPSADGPFYVIEMEITRPISSNIGFVGKQIEETGALLRGGGTQVQFDASILRQERWNYLRPASEPKPLR